MPPQVAFAKHEAHVASATPPGMISGMPVVQHITSRYVELLWDPPLHNGGDAVASYCVAAREGGVGDFSAVMQTADAMCHARVPVPAGTWLEFTVAATNAVGTGPPSKPSMPVLTHRRRGQRRRRRKREGGLEGGHQHGAAQHAGRHKRRHRRRGSWDSDGEEALSVLSLSDSDDGNPGASESGLARSAVDSQDDGARYAAVRHQLARREASMSVALGRRAEDVELAASPTYRALSLEYAELRERRERAAVDAAENAEWQQLLLRLGFDISLHLEALEQRQEQWRLAAMRRHDGHMASVQEQLGSRAYVELQEAVVAGKTSRLEWQRALDRVNTFRELTVLAEALEEAEVRSSLERYRSESGASNAVADGALALLRRFCAHESSGTGALGLEDFSRLIRAELGTVEQREPQGLGAHDTVRGAGCEAHGPGSQAHRQGAGREMIDDARAARMFQRADTNGDGAVDFNELFAYMHHTQGQTVDPMTPAQPAHRRNLTAASALMGQVAVHLAARPSLSDGENAWGSDLSEEAEPASHRNGADGDATGERVRWPSLDTILQENAARKHQQRVVQEHTRKLEEAQRQIRQADEIDVRSLSTKTKCADSLQAHTLITCTECSIRLPPI
jgi:hypothetical protein